MYQFHSIVRPLYAALLCGAIAVPGAVSAAAQCKGLSASQCDTSSHCSWVNGYVRKDGRSVSSHCKSRPSGKAQKSLAPAAPRLGQTR
jgi:hypothetical protein